MAPFDPYHQWLGIPPGEQPPDHYRLLGVPLLESDPDVIEAAAQRQTVFLRTLQLGPQSELAERMLNEVARARVTLLNTAQKAVYDTKLRQSQPLPADPVPDSDRDALSAEITYLRKALEQRDQAVRQGKEELEQERAELAHQQQRLARGVAALKKEQEQQRAQPPHRRLPPLRSASFNSLLSRLTDWILSNVVKIAIVVILGGFLFLALFSVSGPLKEPEPNVANRVTEEPPKEADDKEEVVDATLYQPVVDQTLSEQDDTVPATIETEPASPEVTPDASDVVVAIQELMTAEQLALAAPIKKFMTPEQVDLGGPIVNSIDIVLVPIPAGQFTMGSPETEPDRRDTETQHRVWITKPFYLSAHEVTQQQYESVMQVSPWEGKSNVEEGEDYPATYVNWDDAVAFCDELSKREGEKYRLPTEAQWEYACRAGTTTAYSFDGNASQLGNYAWHSKNAWDIGEHYAHRVGEKLPNPWGLFDMHGNVWEWCQDRYGPYKSLQMVSDPTGPASGSRRVLRGGAFSNRPMNVRAANRHGNQPDLRLHAYGFRLTRTYPLSPAVTGPTVDKLVTPPATPPKMSRAQLALAAPIKKLMTREQVDLGGPFVNSIDIVLVPIPAGEFTMGSPESEPDRRDTETQHRVRITKPFYLSAHEVTQQQYEKVMGNNPSRSKGPTKPVEQVNWNDAVAFCDELSKREGEKYRLPTEAQWEYACRAGTTTAYSFGDDVRQLPQHAWYSGSSNGSTHPVGKKLPNPWGLFDMHGNVWEWCEDWYGTYETKQMLINPSGPASGSSRVLRGGAFLNPPKNVRAANRDLIRPGSRNPYNGFRLTRTYNLSP